jgi:hypothetical protein
MMLRKLVGIIAVFCLTAATAFAANIPLLSGSQYSEPSQILGTVNTVIQSVNSGTAGMLASFPYSVATATGTTEQTLYTYTLPAGYLKTGQALRVKCWGTTGATANNKTRKLYVGTTNVLATATEAANAQPWMIEGTVLITGAATQGSFLDGLAGTGGITPISAAISGTDNFAAAVTIKCTATDATSAAADVTGYGMTIEIVQ